MKTIQTGIYFLVILAAALFLGQMRTAGAQEKKAGKKTPIPSAVLSAFKKAYPDAVIKNAGKEVTGGKTYYEIESVDGNTGRDLLYLPDGTVYEIEESVAASDLPAAVTGAVQKKFPKGKILKAEKLTRGTLTRFELLIKSGKQKLEVVFGPDGKLLKTEKR